MNNSWQSKKLGEVCDKASSNIAQNKIVDNHGQYPLYGASGFIKNIDFFQQDRDYIAIVKDGAGVGRVMLLKPFSSVLGTLQYLVPKENLDIRFFHYFLINLDFRKYINGSTIPHIYFKDYSEEPFPLPPLPEQQRIVKILDEVFAAAAKAKENAEKNLANAGELFQSYLQSVFANPGKGWEEKKLGEVCETTQGVQIEKSQQLKSPKSGYKRYLYISDFQHENNLKYVEDIYPKKIVKPGDLIVVNTGASAGTIYKGLDGILSNNLFKVTFNPTILDSDFIYYFVTSDLFKSFQKTIVRGTANPHMGHENFNSTTFYLPSISVQKEVVAKLDALSAETKKLELIYKQKLAALEELKKSVLAKAFRGEL